MQWHSSRIRSYRFYDGPNKHEEDDEIEYDKDASGSIAPWLDIDNQKIEEAEGDEENDE